MKTKVFLTFAFFFILCNSHANNEKNRRYIEVTGTSELKIIPNEIYLSITLNEADKKDKYSLDNLERKLVNVLKSLKIPTDNLAVSGANSKLAKTFWSKTKIYNKKNYTLKITDAKTLGELLDNLEEQGISRVNIQRLGHSDMPALRKKAKIMAMKAAKDKADYLLGAIGEKTGKPIFIQERNYSAPMFRATNYREKTGYNTKQSYKLNFEEMKIKSEIFGRFEIVE